MSELETEQTESELIEKLVDKCECLKKRNDELVEALEGAVHILFEYLERALAKVKEG